MLEVETPSGYKVPAVFLSMLFDVTSMEVQVGQCRNYFQKCIECTSESFSNIPLVVNAPLTLGVCISYMTLFYRFYFIFLITTTLVLLQSFHILFVSQFGAMVKSGIL